MAVGDLSLDDQVLHSRWRLGAGCVERHDKSPSARMRCDLAGSPIVRGDTPTSPIAAVRPSFGRDVGGEAGSLDAGNGSTTGG